MQKGLQEETVVEPIDVILKKIRMMQQDLINLEIAVLELKNSDK